MRTKKGAAPGKATAAHVERIPHISILALSDSKIKSKIIKYLRTVKNVTASEIIAIVNEDFPKYDKYLESKVERPDEYGVELSGDTMLRLVEAFAPEILQREERKPCKRIGGRLPDEVYDALKAKLQQEGFESVQRWIEYIVLEYIGGVRL